MEKVITFKDLCDRVIDNKVFLTEDEKANKALPCFIYDDGNSGCGCIYAGSDHNSKFYYLKNYGANGKAYFQLEG